MRIRMPAGVDAQGSSRLRSAFIALRLSLTTPHDPPSPPPGVPSDAWLRANELFGDVITLPQDERAACSTCIVATT
jgi:hypothetical protein